MRTSAIILNGSKGLSVELLTPSGSSVSDAVVRILESGISAVPEKPFWSGDMKSLLSLGSGWCPHKRHTAQALRWLQ